jgi:hypothetical protein
LGLVLVRVLIARKKPVLLLRGVTLKIRKPTHSRPPFLMYLPARQQREGYPTHQKPPGVVLYNPGGFRPM